MSLIFYITLATMLCMQNGIFLQRPMVRMHVRVLLGQLNKLLLVQACSSDLSLDKYCQQSLYSSLSILKYLVSNHFGFPLENRHLLEKRLEKSSTLSGSRSNHVFRPSSDSREIQMLLVLDEEAVPINILNSVICMQASFLTYH